MSASKKLTREQIRQIEAEEEEWSDFRINMPYGCDYDPQTNKLRFFNREYSFIGSAEPVDRHGLGLPKREYFYGDGTKPLHAQEYLDKYLEGLRKFDGWVEFENSLGKPSESTAFYLEKASGYKVQSA